MRWAGEDFDLDRARARIARDEADTLAAMAARFLELSLARAVPWRRLGGELDATARRGTAERTGP